MIPLDDLRLKEIPTGTIGIYFLYDIKDSKEKIIYVGRSDTCLRRRLRDHMKNRRASFFTYEVLDDIRGCYNRECMEYHRLIKLGMQNLIHPDKPRNLPYNCEYCSIRKQFIKIKL